jgi:hypothetical protein
MNGILADHNAEGHLEILLCTLLSDEWLGMWNELGVPVLTFAEMDLSPDVDDRTLWCRCQGEEVLLVTNNRNAEGPGSLEHERKEKDTHSLAADMVADWFFLLNANCAMTVGRKRTRSPDIEESGGISRRRALTRHSTVNATR